MRILVCLSALFFGYNVNRAPHTLLSRTRDVDVAVFLLGNPAVQCTCTLPENVSLMCIQWQNRPRTRFPANRLMIDDLAHRNMSSLLKVSAAQLQASLAPAARP